jgi:hypothetical protein
MNVHRADASGKPLHRLWDSGPLETGFGWNYIEVVPPYGLDLGECFEDDPASLGFIVTMEFVGTLGGFPRIGFDNIGTAVDVGCLMHDSGCLPAHWPKTWLGGGDPRVHSGYVGDYRFQYWPPLAIPDAMFFPDDCTGSVDLAWRVYLDCHGPGLTPQSPFPTSWGGIKNLYK